MLVHKDISTRIATGDLINFQEVAKVEINGNEVVVALKDDDTVLNIVIRDSSQVLSPESVLVGLGDSINGDRITKLVNETLLTEKFTAYIIEHKIGDKIWTRRPMSQ